jgi:L-amino acid N-acyltransferase YncA
MQKSFQKDINFIVTKMNEEDWPAVQSIYGEGIATGNSTFEKEAPQWQQWDKSHLPNCRLIAMCKSCGFREVGRRERMGQMDGVWRDVILMECRSKIVGI